MKLLRFELRSGEIIHINPDHVTAVGPISEKDDAGELVTIVGLSGIKFIDGSVASIKCSPDAAAEFLTLGLSAHK